MKRVDFGNIGEEQVEGLIVMSIDDGVSAGKALTQPTMRLSRL